MVYNSITIIQSTEFYNKKVFGNGGDIVKALEERNKAHFPVTQPKPEMKSPCLECSSYFPTCENKVLDRKTGEVYCSETGLVVEDNIFEEKIDFARMSRADREDVELYYLNQEKNTGNFPGY